MLLLQSNQILLNCRPRRSYELPWDAVRDVEVRHSDPVAERVTATRIMTFGISAWAAKKQRKEAVLVLHLDHAVAYFTVRGQTPVELEAALAPLRGLIANRA
jgi:hypothetical protein